MSVKQEILNILTKAGGEYVSGQSLADRLCCSRNAVWKVIQTLRRDGYRIDALTNRGYAFRGGDVFSAEGVARYLKVPFSVDIKEQVTSTNDWLKMAAERGAPEGTVLAAVRQEQGKGRLGRSFFSPAGGLYMSLLLRPVLPANEALMITAAAAVSVVEAIEAVCGRRCLIKWVNDVYLDDRKICGILTEASVNFETGGIKVEHPADGFAGELRERAGAIFEALTETGDVKNRLCAEVLNRFYGYYIRLPEKPFMTLYKERSLLVGKEILIVRGSETVKAVATGIDDGARLLIRREDGREDIVSSGEVSVVL